MTTPRQPARLLGCLWLPTIAVDNLVNSYGISLPKPPGMRPCHRSDIFYPADKTLLNQSVKKIKRFRKKPDQLNKMLCRNVHNQSVKVLHSARFAIRQCPKTTTPRQAGRCFKAADAYLAGAASGAACCAAFWSLMPSSSRSNTLSLIHI